MVFFSIKGSARKLRNGFRPVFFYIHLYVCMYTQHMNITVCVCIFSQLNASSLYCSVDVRLKHFFYVFVHFHLTNTNTSSMRKTIRFPHSRATKGVAIPSLGSVPMPDKTCFIYCHWLSETCQQIRFLSYLYSLRWIASCQTRVLNIKKKKKKRMSTALAAGNWFRHSQVAGLVTWHLK